MVNMINSFEQQVMALNKLQQSAAPLDPQDWWSALQCYFNHKFTLFR